MVTWPLVTAATSRPILFAARARPAGSTRARQTDGERARAREREKKRKRQKERKEGRRIQGIGAGEPRCATGKKQNDANGEQAPRLPRQPPRPAAHALARSLPGLPSASLGLSRRPGRPEAAAGDPLRSRPAVASARGLAKEAAGGSVRGGRAHGRGGPPQPARPRASGGPGRGPGQLPSRA